MKRLLTLVLFAGFACPAFAQTDTLIRKLDSLSKRTDSTGGQVNNTSPRAYNKYTQITPRSFLVLQASSLKQAFTKPFRMTGRDWKTAGKFAVVLGALAFADEPVQRFALDLRNSNRGLRDISAQLTEFGGTYEGYTLAALGAYGFLFRKEKMQTTTLLAAQSYVTGSALMMVLKFVTGRQRPLAVDGTNLSSGPRFRGPFYKLRDKDGNRLNGAFPSGHTTVAFAAATVYALEYKEKLPWVPWLAYSAAGLIGISRITENKHWVTDVVAGAGLGYLTGKLVVNNYHRYARLKAPKQSKNSVSVTMGYQFGQVLPGLVYHF